MKISEALKISPISKLETEIILSAVLKKDRSFLHAFPETSLTSNETQKLSDYLKKRKNNEPLAYILGYKLFFGLRFLVTKDVLIPREETEKMIENILEYCQKNNLITPTIVDVGTGSGCIAVALGTKLPKANIIAVDKSAKALEVAKKNSQLHQTKNLSFLQSDLLNRTVDYIDIIAANLPYIPTKTWEKLPLEIKHFEPRVALDSGVSAMSYYNELFDQARNKLSKTGRIFYELDGDIIQVSADDLAGTPRE